MTTRTCCVCLGAGGVLAAGLVGGLAAYLQGGPAAAAQGRPDHFRYVPADAHTIAFADVRAVMTSDLRARMRDRQSDDERPEFESRTGIRVARDIDQVVASLAPSATGDADLLVVLSGRFDERRLETLAVENGGTVSEYAGHTLVSTTWATAGWRWRSSSRGCSRSGPRLSSSVRSSSSTGATTSRRTID